MRVAESAPKNQKTPRVSRARVPGGWSDENVAPPTSAVKFSEFEGALTTRNSATAAGIAVGAVASLFAPAIPGISIVGATIGGIIASKISRSLTASSKNDADDDKIP